VLAVYFAPSGTVGVLKADEAKSNWPLQARARRASGSLGQIRSQLSLRRETRLFHMRAAPLDSLVMEGVRTRRGCSRACSPRRPMWICAGFPN
jgi:hypothetical protein